MFYYSKYTSSFLRKGYFTVLHCNQIELPNPRLRAKIGLLLHFQFIHIINYSADDIMIWIPSIIVTDYVRIEIGILQMNKIGIMCRFFLCIQIGNHSRSYKGCIAERMSLLCSARYHTYSVWLNIVQFILACAVSIAERIEIRMVHTQKRKTHFLLCTFGVWRIVRYVNDVPYACDMRN